MVLEMPIKDFVPFDSQFVASRETGEYGINQGITKTNDLIVN